MQDQVLGATTKAYQERLRVLGDQVSDVETDRADEEDD